MRIGIFDNQHEAVKELPEERQGAFWVAFFAYVFDGVEPEFSEPMERMAWNLVKPYIEKSKTAGQNGEKGGRKPKQKTKAKNQTEKPKQETKTGNQALSESESEREGLGESLKDSLNPSQAVAGADADTSAPRPGDGLDVFRREKARFDEDERIRLSKAERDMAEQRRIMDEAEANAVPCPASVAELVRGIA